jgi:hypothetical protein
MPTFSSLPDAVAFFDIEGGYLLSRWVYGPRTYEVYDVLQHDEALACGYEADWLETLPDFSNVSGDEVARARLAASSAEEDEEVEVAPPVRPNRYAGACFICGSRVASRAGTLRRVGTAWMVAHLPCASGSPQVYEVRTSSGWIGTRNVRGRCEDAPCCGCCTF